MSLLMEALKQAEFSKCDKTQERPTEIPIVATVVETHASAPLTLAPLKETVPLAVDETTESFAAALLAQAQEAAHKFETPPMLDQAFASGMDVEPSPVLSGQSSHEPAAPVETPALAIAPVANRINTGAEAAARILAASASRQTAARRRKLIGNIGLGLVLCIAVGGYYYYATLGQLPPPRFQPKSEQSAESTGQPAPIAVNAPAQAVQTLAPESATATHQGTPQPEKPPLSASVASSVAVQPQMAANHVESRPMAPEPAADESYIDMASRGIRVTRSQTVDTVFVDLQNAYTAYKSGQWQLAVQRYQHVLIQQRDNRDARLGLAALAVRAGNITVARHYYQELLSMNPKDSAALAALADLSDSHTSGSESDLKSMISDNPQTAQLHFALANVYAGQQRWEYAQQEYFEAQRLAVDNPDYAFNLAVSLEHLGQPRTALNFYQRALKLAQRHPAQFATVNARQRIDILLASVHP